MKFVIMGTVAKNKIQMGNNIACACACVCVWKV